MDAQLRNFVREALMGFEPQAPGITDHVLANAVSTTAAQCPDDVANLSRSQTGFLQSRWDSAALRPHARYLQSPSGRRYVSALIGPAIQASAGAGEIPPEQVEAVLAALSDEDRADLANVQNRTPSLGAVLNALAGRQGELVAELMSRRSRELEAPVLGAARAFVSARVPRQR